MSGDDHYDVVPKQKRRGKAHREVARAKTKQHEDSTEEVQPNDQANDVPREGSSPDSTERKITANRKEREKHDATGQSGDEGRPSVTPAERAPNTSKRRRKNRDLTRPVEDTHDPTSHSTVEPRSRKKAAPRFIVFVGNLPYNVTTSAISAHFSAVSPSSVRAPTDKSTGIGKGFAFLEFDRFDHMKSCLKMYHHSTFYEDGASKKRAASREKGAQGTADSGRKINVELTAGGGGNSETRRAKLKAKNSRLHDQRKRRIRAEQEASKARKQQHSQGPGLKESEGKTPQVIMGEGGETGVHTPDGGDHQGVHPARLARMR